MHDNFEIYANFFLSSSFTLLDDSEKDEEKSWFIEIRKFDITVILLNYWQNGFLSKVFDMSLTDG